MKTTTTTLTECKHIEKTHFTLEDLTRLMHGAGEIVGFITSLVLFLVMGPFSAIAVIPALFSLCSKENRQAMQEPESC